VPNPAEPTPPAPAPTRSSAVMRGLKALGETRLQLILALIITVGAGFWAWSLAAGSFAAQPQISAPPGVIGVAVESSARTMSAPITMQVDYYPPGNPTSGLGISFTQAVSGSKNHQLAPVVVVFLCGQIAEGPGFDNQLGQLVKWQVPVSPDHEAFSTVFGSLSACVYTKLALGTSDAPKGYRDASLGGYFLTATSEVSGTRVLYALPGLADWVPPAPIDGLSTVAMPRGSTLTLTLDQDPSGFENVLADPQLSDPPYLRWTSKIDGTAAPVAEYQLEADSVAGATQLQVHLFISGALVGVAGAAFLWLVQLCGQAGFEAAEKRGKRTRSAADQEDEKSTADHEDSELAVPEPVKPDGAGLGWPD
jgi:hypothetical protein